MGQSYNAVNIFVGGVMDSKYLPVKRYLDYPQQNPVFIPNSAYFGFEHRAAIEDYIKRKVSDNMAINLIGHSYGAETIACIAVRLRRTINLLITADPVSRFGVGTWFGPSYAHVASHATTWININATGGGLIEGGNGVARAGGLWNEKPKQHATIYYEVPVVHARFTQMMKFVGPDGKSAEDRLRGCS